jgi:hypothetical protein
VQPGVYEARHFTGVIRVVVHELPREENNALLHLFSAEMDQVRYGATHYQQRSEETSTLLLQLFEQYQLEATLMSDALQEFARETINELLKKLPPEERLKGLSVDQRLAGLSADQLLAALSPETRQELAQRLKESDSVPKPEATKPEEGAG